jgi:hypothetical protein
LFAFAAATVIATVAVGLNRYRHWLARHVMVATVGSKPSQLIAGLRERRSRAIRATRSGRPSPFISPMATPDNPDVGGDCDLG